MTSITSTTQDDTGEAATAVTDTEKAALLAALIEQRAEETAQAAGYHPTPAEVEAMETADAATLNAGRVEAGLLAIAAPLAELAAHIGRLIENEEATQAAHEARQAEYAAEEAAREAARAEQMKEIRTAVAESGAAEDAARSAGCTMPPVAQTRVALAEAWEARLAKYAPEITGATVHTITSAMNAGLGYSVEVVLPRLCTTADLIAHIEDLAADAGVAPCGLLITKSLYGSDHKVQIDVADRSMAARLAGWTE